MRFNQTTLLNIALIVIFGLALTQAEAYMGDYQIYILKLIFINAILALSLNLIYGFTTGDNITLVYALTSFFIGIAVGVMARLGYMKTLPKAMLTACAGGFAAVLVSTPLNIIFWGGTTGNVWGDAVFAATQAAKMPVFLGSLLDEIVVDVPDKIITLAIVYFIIKGLPKKLTALYDAGSDIQSLD